MENNPGEDAAVMDQVRDGRLDALAVLFERHHLHLFHFFQRLCGQPAVSEDLVQEVFVRLLRYRASYRPGSPFAPWMWRIARNVLHDQGKARPSWQSVEEPAETWPDPAAGAELQAIREQDADHLRQALARLAPAKRELLLLSRNPELAYDDLAAMLGCTVGSVKVQVHRALKELKAAFFNLQGVTP